MARGWYLIVYDVRDPKRLKRLHYRLRKQAMALQQSVFVIEADQRRLNEVLDMMAKIIHSREDDVRAYPIQHPAQLWLHGQNALHDGVILPDAERDAKAVATGTDAGLLTRLWATVRGR